MPYFHSLLQVAFAACFLFGAPPPASAQAVHETHIRVQIQGAVKRPGIYNIMVGSRVAELIGQAGGPCPNADLKSLNLTQVLNDGEKCQVAIRAVAAPAAHVQVASLPTPHHKGRHKKSGATRVKGVAGKGHGKKGTSVKYGKDTPVHVHINSASAPELMTLPGVGAGIAAAILKQRQHQGRFHSIEDLMEVSGFGQKRLERVRPYVLID
jgi:competence protein ComEA